ncbi:MAG: 2-alkyl-3-oxoalkanoate reductase [Syntrophus sp. SKADARSKE-3]|nr:2-alkyl-3-oxoalkanoate reductase [Syntrophus sp. SKADARSKE-3]
MIEIGPGLEVLVTGGGGFLGRALVKRLLAEGCAVRSFSRGNYPELRAMGVTVLRGDLADQEAVRRACDGCAVVFHNAAQAGIWGDYDAFYRPNVTGTENILNACRAGGVGRLVYTSSASVVFGDADIAGGNESIPYPENPRSPYTATKAMAERLVLAADSPSLRTLSLRPHLIWGPEDTQIIPRILARARTGRVRRVGDGTNIVDTTYIDNCVDAHLLAARALADRPEAAGRPFFISNGEPVNLWQLINTIVKLTDIAPITRSIPRGAAMLLGTLVEGVYRGFQLTGEPPMTRFLVEEVSTSHWFDISAARQILDYVPAVSMEEGLRRLGIWLKKKGY